MAATSTPAENAMPEPLSRSHGDIRLRFGAKIAPDSTSIIGISIDVDGQVCCSVMRATGGRRSDAGCSSGTDTQTRIPQAGLEASAAQTRRVGTGRAPVPAQYEYVRHRDSACQLRCCSTTG